MIAVSIVSHGQGDMVEKLVASLLLCHEVRQIIVTQNIPEAVNLPVEERVQLIDNAVPRGFGANHNSAFEFCRQPFFCVLNPDITLIDNPFLTLIKVMRASGATLTAPLILSPKGRVEDSVRRFPTISSLCSKGLGGKDGRYSIALNDPSFYPEWVAGMFMLFRSESFSSLKGFDESFFLYYEDVDICVRLWKAGMRIVVCTTVSVIHDARRASRHEFQHMKWHAVSMLKYFWKHGRKLPSVG